MRFHRHERVEAEPRQDPLAAAIWQDGLSHATASGGLVIHAPHAADLLPKVVLPTTKSEHSAAA
ncbi:MAG: hypothetical protein QOH64_3541 [Acidimicrobiaceae bacterium]|jgi:hypothetical protein